MVIDLDTQTQRDHSRFPAYAYGPAMTARVTCTECYVAEVVRRMSRSRRSRLTLLFADVELFGKLTGGGTGAVACYQAAYVSRSADH